MPGADAGVVTVLLDVSAWERWFAQRLAAQDADSTRLIALSTQWSPPWGSLSWARERYGVDFLRTHRWLEPKHFLAEVGL